MKVNKYKYCVGDWQAEAHSPSPSDQEVSGRTFCVIGDRFQMNVVGTVNLEQGIAYKIEGNYDEAIKVFQAILAEEPNSSEAHHQLGLVYGFIGLFDESLEELQRSIRLDGTNLVTHNDLALTYAMLGMNDDAKSEFELVLRADPSNEVARKNIIFFE